MEYKNRKKILSFANRRGLGNLGLHGLRRIGTLTQRAITGPIQIRINPFSYICNHRCFMCNLQNMPSEELAILRHIEKRSALNLEDYKDIFDNRLPGLISVNITGGGEPLMHPDITGIMSEIKKYKLKGSLITNGIGVTKQFSQQAVDMNWDGIRVSIHAGDAQTYKNVCGMDNYHRLKENLIFFNKYRRKKRAQSQCQMILFNVIQRENIRVLDKIFETAEEVGADHVEFEKLIPFNKDFKLSPQELRTAKDRLISCAANSKVSCNLATVLKQLNTEAFDIKGHQAFRPAKRCSVGFDQMFITSEGDVYPCCFSNEKMGNLRIQSLKETWNNAQYASFRKRLIRGKFEPYCYENRCTLPGVLHNW